MTAKTLQDRLDAEADLKLNTKLCNEFKRFKDALHIRTDHNFVVQLTNGQKGYLQIAQALTKLQNHLFEKQKDGYRNKETDAFIKRVHHFESGLDTTE